MSVELIKVYNKKNEPYNGYVNRELLPIKNKYFNIVNVWIIDINKNILIQQRSQNKKLFPNKFECVAGATIKDESIQESVIREVDEELGIKISSNQLIFINKLIYNKPCYFANTYFLLLNYPINIEKIDFNKNEVQSIKLIDYPKLKQMIKQKMFSDDINKRFKKLKKYFKLYTKQK